MMDPACRNISRLFVLLFKSGVAESKRYSYDEYYMLLVEIKYFNVLIDKKPFDQPAKSKQEAYEKLVKIYSYKTKKLSDLSYRQSKYKHITIDLLRKRNSSIPQQINFIGKLEEENDVSMFFVAEKQQKFILNFSIDSLNVKE